MLKYVQFLNSIMTRLFEWGSSDNREARLVLSVGPEGTVDQVPVEELRGRAHQLALDESGTDDEFGEFRGRDGKLTRRAENGRTDRDFNRENRQGRRIY